MLLLRLHSPVTCEGWPYILPALALSLLAAPRRPRLALGSLVAAAAFAAFFRDPARDTPHIPDLLYAPADGRILHVEEVATAPFIGGPAWRVATFLSLLDVHINRSPTTGLVRFREHTPGAFRSAWDPGVERLNERAVTGIETTRGPVVVVQIAGLIARRIVTYPRVDDRVAQGQRLGLIKFSSRTDLLLPRDSTRPLVQPGEKVRGGLTPLAVWV